MRRCPSEAAARQACAARLPIPLHWEGPIAPVKFRTLTQQQKAQLDAYAGKWRIRRGSSKMQRNLRIRRNSWQGTARRSAESDLQKKREWKDIAGQPPRRFRFPMRLVDIGWFPKTRGTFFGLPIMKTTVFCTLLGKLPFLVVFRVLDLAHVSGLKLGSALGYSLPKLCGRFRVQGRI